MQWAAPPSRRSGSATVRYTGRLADHGRALNLHLGFDGWQQPMLDLDMQRTEDGSWVVDIPSLDGHLVVDCVISDRVGPQRSCDNNHGVDYRLWIALDPVDSHVHARDRGSDRMGFDSLRTAFFSSGMTHALVSWRDNDFIDRVADGVPWLTKLVWVHPGGPSVDDVQRRLAVGAVGLKLHPSYDGYAADSDRLDGYLRVADERNVPVTVHSSVGPSDPDLIRRLAERFPRVSFVLYHTFLGPDEGRRRASRHARELPNLFLETSWCRSGVVERLVDEAGPERVLFGSDAAIDGPRHYVRQPPNIEFTETYNSSLLLLARRLGPEATRAVYETNTRRLFGLPGAEESRQPIEDTRPRRLTVVRRRPGDDVRTLFRPALDQVVELAGEVRPDRLAGDTPCAEWDVGTLLGHLLATVRRAAAIADGDRAPRLPYLATLPRGETWAGSLRAARTDALSAWDREGWEAGVPVPWGEVPAGLARSAFVLELVAHGWDLATALDQRSLLRPELAEPALALAQQLLPATWRTGLDPYRPPVATAPAADGYTRLAAFLGRRTAGQ